MREVFEGELLFAFWLIFLLQIFSINAFVRKIFPELPGLILAALSVNGLNCPDNNT